MKYTLEKVVLKKHPLFGESFEISFTDENDFNNKEINDAPYTSLIIGSNGTGKSYLLKEVADILLYLKDIKENESEKNFTRLFELTYSINSRNFIIRNFTTDNKKVKRDKITIIENKNITKLDSLLLPENLLVSSLLINDKFTVKNSFTDYYKYLGIRNLKTPSMAGTKSYIKRTLDLIYGKLNTHQTEITDNIKSLLKFLEYKEVFKVSYKLRYKDKFFNQNLTTNKFDSLFQNFNDPNLGFSTRKDSEFIPFGVRYYKSVVKDNPQLKKEIVEFINFIREELQNNLSFDILIDKLPLNYYGLLSDLNSLDLISFPQLNLKKKETDLSIDQISSGEFHMLTSFMGIYSSINHNSLVLIDEPEISLHPNWQMRYVSYLKEIFKKYQSCHFIITSHSHFFASDLDGRHSKIIGLKRDLEDKIEVVDLPKGLNTYGWSAEDVLYNVFGVLSTRNRFIAEDIAKILNKLSTNINLKSKIISKENYEELLYLNNNLKENDPLKSVVQLLINKIN